MRNNRIQKLRFYFKLFDAILGIVSCLIVYLFYIFMFTIFKLTYYSIVLRLILMKHRLPRELRKKIVLMYEEKLTELLSLDIFEKITLFKLRRKRKRIDSKYTTSPRSSISK